MFEIAQYKMICEEAVRAAGAVLVARQGRVAVREKGPADLVTEADLAAQEVVRKTVLSAFPEHVLLGEEDPPGPRRQAAFRWIVDPLDGTMNYVHGLPFYSVSLALEHEGQLVVGAVYDPIRDECYMAVRGGGAELNGRPIRANAAAGMAQAMAVVGFPAIVERDSPDLLVFLEALAQCRSLRRFGSAALNLAYMAAGRVDIFWSFSTKIWDIAAGVLLVREAGGAVTAPTGEPLVLDEARFVAAANAELHGQFTALVRRALQGDNHG